MPQVRETARAQVGRFVMEWLLRSYPDAEQYQVEVFFADESPGWQAASVRP